MPPKNMGLNYDICHNYFVVFDESFLVLNVMRSFRQVYQIHFLDCSVY